MVRQSPDYQIRKSSHSYRNGTMSLSLVARRAGIHPARARTAAKAGLLRSMRKP